MNKILVKVVIIAVILLTLLSMGQYYSKNKIILAQKDYYNQQLNNLLSEIKFNNNLLDSKIVLTNPKYLEYLGYSKSKTPVELYIAKLNQQPVAVILNSTAPDGYNGKINFLIAISLNINKQNKIINIKILNHQETPGLGDLIEPEKSPWLSQFTNRFLVISPEQNNYPWQAKKHKNTQDNQAEFDSITGATITSQAVTQAVYRSLLLIHDHPEVLNN